MNGKFKIYFARQDQFPDISTAQLEAKNAEVAKLGAEATQLEGAVLEQTMLSHRLSNEPSDAELDDRFHAARMRGRDLSTRYASVLVAQKKAAAQVASSTGHSSCSSRSDKRRRSVESGVDMGEASALSAEDQMCSLAVILKKWKRRRVCVLQGVDTVADMMDERNKTVSRLVGIQEDLPGVYIALEAALKAFERRKTHPEGKKK